MNITRRTAATITAITTAIILTPAAALAIIAFKPAPPATPETLDANICDNLVYEMEQLDGQPVENLDVNDLLDWIQVDLDQADGVQPTEPFADSINMLQRVKDEPAQTRVLALDILTTRCIDAGHINL